jgi:hypothetical protein
MMRQGGGATPQSLKLALNWFEELKRLAPAGKRTVIPHEPHRLHPQHGPPDPSFFLVRRRCSDRIPVRLVHERTPHDRQIRLLHTA